MTACCPDFLPSRSLKWYRKLAVHFIEEALQNAFITFKQHSPRRISHRIFIIRACSVLIISAGAETGSTPVGSNQLDGKHFAQHIPPILKKQLPTKRCVVCQLHKVRRESRYQCKQCLGRPGLCVDPCFEKYHTRKNLR